MHHGLHSHRSLRASSAVSTAIRKHKSTASLRQFSISPAASPSSPAARSWSPTSASISSVPEGVSKLKFHSTRLPTGRLVFLSTAAETHPAAASRQKPFPSAINTRCRGMRFPRLFWKILKFPFPLKTPSRTWLSLKPSSIPPIQANGNLQSNNGSAAFDGLFAAQSGIGEESQGLLRWQRPHTEICFLIFAAIEDTPDLSFLAVRNIDRSVRRLSDAIGTCNCIRWVHQRVVALESVSEDLIFPRRLAIFKWLKDDVVTGLWQWRTVP